MLRRLNSLFSFERDPFVKLATNNAIVNVFVEPEVMPIEKKPIAAEIKVKKKKRVRLSNEEARKYLLETVFNVTLE